MPCIRQGLRFGYDTDAGLFQPRGEAVQGTGVGDFPAKETRAFAHRAVDDDALLAVVHAERQQRIAALDRLQADQAGAELPPVLQGGRAEPGISQTEQCHVAPPACPFRTVRLAAASTGMLRGFRRFQTSKLGPAEACVAGPIP